jgi:hypothetical protein
VLAPPAAADFLHKLLMRFALLPREPSKFPPLRCAFTREARLRFTQIDNLLPQETNDPVLLLRKLAPQTVLRLVCRPQTLCLLSCLRELPAQVHDFHLRLGWLAPQLHKLLLQSFLRPFQACGPFI